MKEYIKMLALFNVAASIIFIWVHSPYNDSSNSCNHIENLYNIEITSDIRFHRLLAKQVPKNELSHSSVKNKKILENHSYNNVKCTSDDLSKYTQLKKRGLNDLNLYKKLYKHRSSKKNILGKFDCYCEKKIFDKFDHMLNLSEKMNTDKKRLKSFVFKKCGIVPIIIVLLLLLGLIYPILRCGDNPILKICAHGCDKHNDPSVSTGKSDHFNKIHKSFFGKDTLEMIEKIYEVLIYVVPLIFLMILLYIFIKILKYQKLKSGRDKMSLKQYYNFTKSLL
ncbi:hypothetical protein PVMG_06114 [Plasmodium vivax Mauritania I]|uniref:Variable surface protein n=1 Tax=Plasmodium vivax Mauritania I TaxID=1035515 RepID=A0A0J9W3R4_PLAVI|nr:hypothetical protein PVMG_06114 [Plasmodium vivax Mauritania I]